MDHDFDKAIERRGTDSIKWAVPERELPMWVADMDFAAPPAVRRAIEARAAEGVFGYCTTNDAWRQAYVSWWRSRYGLEIAPESLIFAAGIVPAVGSIVRRLTEPGEKVLMLTPIYNAFYHCIRDNGRVALEIEMPLAGDRYEIDFAALEAGLADPQTTLMILCNPHNPIGKIWERETLQRIGEHCAKHGVAVVADEIHCDLTLPGRTYVPFASVSELCRRISVSCFAPSKTFNLAGMHSSALMVSDPQLRHRIAKGIANDGIGSTNTFAVPATVAAYTESGAWLDELREYLAENRRQTERFVAENIPQLRVLPGEATYLLWIDCRALPGGGADFPAFLRKETGLFVNAGSDYGKGGAGFLRLNVACTRATLADGLQRLKAGAERRSLL